MELCDGFIERARQMWSNMDMSMFSFGLHIMSPVPTPANGVRYISNRPWLLESFGGPAPDTDAFNLRLIELVVAVIHHISGHLFTLKPGNHSKKQNSRIRTLNPFYSPNTLETRNFSELGASKTSRPAYRDVEISPCTSTYMRCLTPRPSNIPAKTHPHGNES